MNTPLFVFGLIWAGVWLCSCMGERAGGTAVGADAPELPVYDVDTLLADLDDPRGMVWATDGQLFITERTGSLIRFERTGQMVQRLGGFPTVDTAGQGGFMDIGRHPDYAENGWLYCTYAHDVGVDGTSTALARFRVRGNRLADWEQLYTSTPVESAVHFGSRLLFDRDGYLFVSVGDRGFNGHAQDLTNDLGKVLRLHDDGRIPTDNPFVDTSDVVPSIWSYGHLNIQGMAYDSVNDVIYATEHGPVGGDELNRIERKRNYGWPAITYGIGHNDEIISAYTKWKGMEQPIHYWTPAIGPSGLLFYKGTQYKNWDRGLFAGALAGKHLSRIVLSNGRYRGEEKLLSGIGPVRQVVQDSAGYIFVLVGGNPGMLLKLIPVV